MMPRQRGSNHNNNHASILAIITYQLLEHISHSSTLAIIPWPRGSQSRPRVAAITPASACLPTLHTISTATHPRHTPPPHTHATPHRTLRAIKPWNSSHTSRYGRTRPGDTADYYSCTDKLWYHCDIGDIEVIWTNTCCLAQYSKLRVLVHPNKFYV